MMDTFVAYTVNTLYVLGIASLIVSVLTYLYLPKALKILFEEEEDDEWSRYSDLLYYILLDGRINL